MIMSMNLSECPGVEYVGSNTLDDYTNYYI